MQSRTDSDPRAGLVYVVSNDPVTDGNAVLGYEGDGHPYQIALDPSEQFLHIVEHRTFDETPVGEGNVLNVLRVDADGRLEEVPTSPLKLPVRDDLLARPQGVVAL